jgi:hypothetical protein
MGPSAIVAIVIRLSRCGAVNRPPSAPVIRPAILKFELSRAIRFPIGPVGASTSLGLEPAWRPASTPRASRPEQDSELASAVRPALGPRLSPPRDRTQWPVPASVATSQPFACACVSSGNLTAVVFDDAFVSLDSPAPIQSFDQPLALRVMSCVNAAARRRCPRSRTSTPARRARGPAAFANASRLAAAPRQRLRVGSPCLPDTCDAFARSSQRPRRQSCIEAGRWRRSQSSSEHGDDLTHFLHRDRGRSTPPRAVRLPSGPLRASRASRRDGFAATRQARARVRAARSGI